MALTRSRSLMLMDVHMLLAHTRPEVQDDAHRLATQLKVDLIQLHESYVIKARAHPNDVQEMLARDQLCSPWLWVEHHDRPRLSLIRYPLTDFYEDEIRARIAMRDGPDLTSS